MHVLSKAEALARLDLHKRELLKDGSACVMCALVAGAGELRVIAESEHGAVSLDEFGSRRGHLLVISRRHVETVTALSFPEFVGLQRLVFDACHVLERLMAPQRVYVAALGASKPLPMSYPHYHVHVVPVCEEDERSRPAAVFSWSEGVIAYEGEEARRLTAELREAWDSIAPRAVP